MNALFEVVEESLSGVEEALAWQTENFPSVWQWTTDRDLVPPQRLVADNQLRHRGLLPAERPVGSGVDSRFPKAVVDQLSADCAVHLHAASMVADRAPIRLVGVPSLLCSLYVNETRELFLPGWLDAEALTVLFPPGGSFPAARSVCLTWLVLDAAVRREPGREFATFAFFFTREGTDPGARWHWRANSGRD
ncbi:hypothetical protein ACTG9Q_27250 [Actinokineospora sp. 24-640]